MGDNRSIGEKEEAPFPLTETDMWVLSQTDEEFKLHNWDELKEIIGELDSLVSIFLCPLPPSKADIEAQFV
jgi:hypothetical protein